MAEEAQECKHNLFSEELHHDDMMEYTIEESTVIGTIMEELQTRYMYGQQYSLKRGLKKFGEAGETAAIKEIQQLCDRTCFKPISIGELNNSERRKAQIALAYLTQKRDGKIKGRTVYNGKPTRQWLSKQDRTSPTVSLESLCITGVIDALENRDVMTADVPNAFIQTDGCLELCL